MQQLCCGKTSKTTRPHVKIQKSLENEILEILRAGHTARAHPPECWHGQPDRIRLPRADGMQARLGALQEQLASAGAGSVLLGHHS